MKKLLVVALVTVVACFARGADIEIPAGETLTVTDFSSVTYGDMTCVPNDIITLNEGAGIKVAAGVANADQFFKFYINLKGNATLDLSDYNAETSFRLYTGVYTANPDTFKLTVVNAPDKVFCVGGSSSYVSYQASDSPSCMISKGALDLPSDTKLHFAGCTLFYRFPSHISDISYDLGSSKSSASYQPTLVACGPDAFGTDEREIVVTNFNLVVFSKSVNSNQTLRVCKSAIGSGDGAGYYLKGITWTQTGVKTAKVEGSTTVGNNVCLAGGTLYSRGSSPNYAGNISGTGTVHITRWWQSATLSGKILADNNLNFTIGQLGGSWHFKNKEIAKPVGCLNFTEDAVKLDSSLKTSNGYYFELDGYNTKDTYVPVAKVNAKKVIALETGALIGATVHVYGRQTVDIGILTGERDASSGGGLIFNDGSAKGRTQINVGSLEKTMQVYLSTNTAFTVTNVLATVSPTFNYYRSAGANRTTLKFVNGSTEGTIVKGASPNVLPRRIEGHQGALTIGEGISNPAWAVSVDPSDADAVIDGCEGSGALTVPAQGTIEVRNVSGESLPAGQYPILTCTSGGAALSESNWPVTFTGWQQGNMSIERGETGLWLRVRDGTLIIVK